MVDFVAYLSKDSTKMIDTMLEEMRNYNFSAINFPIFLHGILNVGGDDYDTSFEAYLKNNGATTTKIEDAISSMVADYCNKLQTALDKKEIDEQLTSEVSATLEFKNFNKKEIKVPADKEIAKINECLLKIISNYFIEEITPIHFILAMFMAKPKELKMFFDNLSINYSNAQKSFTSQNYLEADLISFELSSFLEILNDKFDESKPCEILKRDTEIEALWNIMLKKNKRNAVIIGEAGVGKTALIEKIAYDINAEKCPEQFRTFKVVTLDVNALIAGTSYRGDAEERIQELIEFLKDNSDVILFIDEVHTILGAGSCYEGEMDLANALKPILARGETIVIGATTKEEYEKYFQRDAALSRRFEKVEVKEPMSKDVYPMIKNKLRVLSNFHGVKIQKAMVEYAIMIANCFNFNKRNPDKTLDLIDRAMVSAKRENKEYVDKASILKNFGIFFKMWDNMDIDTKKEVAYHEAGHYIVGKASGRLISYNWLGVSIMPAEDYLGVTVYEADDSKVPFRNIDYFIDKIAFDLAGRISENIFRNSYTAGASEDLSSATKTAFDVVTKLGMGSASIKNRIFLNTDEYPMFSEKSTDIINQEVNELIDKAFNRATELLKENEDILNAIVDALLKNNILSEIELDKIWQRVVKKRKKT